MEGVLKNEREKSEGSFGTDSVMTPFGEGQALDIPQGKVHRIEIGSSGVTYRMWTPVELPKPFRLDLDQDVLQLIERNLRVPEQENQWDRRNPSTSWEELRTVFRIRREVEPGSGVE